MEAADPRRWRMLAAGLAAQAASSAFLYGLPFLLPQLRAADHLSLAAGGLVVVAPALGLMATLVAWGAAVDRYGERVTMTLGLALTGLLVAAATTVTQPALLAVALGLAGASAGPVNSAGGRVVMGWFPPGQRGVAMGARQMAQPIGVALAALILPPLAAGAGVRLALAAPAGLCLLMAVVAAVAVIDPPRPDPVPASGSARAANPYRGAALWRVHASSALLVVPQFAVSAFSEEYLVSVRHWAPGPAGRVLAVVQFAGAFGRLAAGRWSDRAGSRLGPMRRIAVASAVAMAALGAAAASGSAVVLVALGAAAVISVSDNGLGYTATAELAGSAWAGRALGVQNTGQNLVAFLTAPLFALAVGAGGYPLAYLACAAFPAVGILTVPVAAEAPLPPSPPPGGRRRRGAAPPRPGVR